MSDEYGASGSAPSQSGSQAGSGAFNVGGGDRKSWLWPVAIVVIVLVFVFVNRKSK